MINKIVLTILLVGILFFGFKYWSITKLTKSLITQAIELNKEIDLCIDNKTQLISILDKQNKAVLALKEEVKARGRLIETTKLKNAELISDLSTKVDKVKESKKIESCDEGIDWLLKEAIND